MKTAIVTGVSSGVGRATALALVNAGWEVYALARRAAALEQVRGELPENLRGRFHAHALDITDAAALAGFNSTVVAKLSQIDALINAAGTNIPQRSLAELTEEKFREVFDTNLTGALSLIQAVLPAMRKAQSGTIININSIAGQNASILSGAAYVMSKFALAGLTQTINLEEARHNIRATSIFPGDINTGILEKRPVRPSEEARAKMLQPDDIADCILMVLNLPARAVVEELRITPR